MTLLFAYNSGRCMRRCDAKCHDAKEVKCACVCGGVFHGKGSGTPELRQVMESRAPEVLEGLRSVGLRVELGPEAVQSRLFNV